MDKRTILALILIGVLFLAWSYFSAVEAPKQTTRPVPPHPTEVGRKGPATSHTTQAAPLPKYLAGLAQGNGRFVTIETPLYKATINSQGGLLYRYELKNYRSWYGAPSQLVEDSKGFPGVVGLDLREANGSSLPTDGLYFTVDAAKDISIGPDDSAVVVARLSVPSADSTVAPGLIEKRFVFRGNSYGIGVAITTEGIGRLGAGGYGITWKEGLKYQEHNSVEESNRARAMALVSDELVDLDNSEAGTSRHETFKGSTAWAGMHTKYFGMAFIPDSTITNARVDVTGRARHADSNGMVEQYDLTLGVPPGTPTFSMTLFVGPLEYDATRKFNLEPMIDMGARFIIRPIGEYFLLPVFRFLHGFIPNYGVVIIVFSLLIRLMLWPLSVPQMRSMRKTQLLQPILSEARERFKDDPQRQQMETMKVYREYGVNPIGGCLPTLLQMPILYALWGTLSSAIDLRQASFAFWIHDLSSPDYILPLPFSLPLVGNKLAGLALVMGATLFVQQKMLLTDPRQKMMVYFFPVLLTMTFNFLPSGLNLYYLSFNLMAIGQQLYYTKWSRNQPTLEQLRAEAKGKKKGWLATKMEEAQKMAEQQKRMADGRTAVTPRKRKE